MTGAGAVEIALLVSPHAAADDLGRAVRLYCAGDSARTIKRVAQESGIPEKRLRKLIENQDEERRPASLAEALSIWAVIGTRGASTSLARIGMVAEPEEAEPESITHAAAGLAMASGKLAVIAADGSVDLDEAEAADRAADEAIENALALKSAAKRVRKKAQRR